MKYLAALLVMLTFVWVGNAQGGDPGKPGAIKNNPIVIEGGVSKRMSVIFSHKSHKSKGFNCLKCHHESSSNSPYSSCRDCHSEPGAQERNPMSMFMAFHAKDTDRSCLGCHTMLAEKHPNAYPSFKGCRPCHSTSAREAALEALKSKE